VALQFEAAAIDDELGALLDPEIDIGAHLVEVLLRHQRTHLGLGVGAGADLQGPHPRHQPVHQLVADPADRDRHRYRHAALPGGSPASVSSSAMRSPADGSRSDGFKMKVLPVAIAIGNIHIGTIAGKLNGVMPAQTPRGWRTDQLSMPRPTCSVNSPFSRCGM